MLYLLLDWFSHLWKNFLLADPEHLFSSEMKVQGICVTLFLNYFSIHEPDIQYK